MVSYLTQSGSSLPHVNSVSKWGFCFTNEPKMFNPNAIDSQYIVVEYNTIVTQYEREKVWTLLRLWIHKRHPIPRPYGRAMGHLFWVLWRKDTVRYRECNGSCHRQNLTKNACFNQACHYSSVIPAGNEIFPGTIKYTSSCPFRLPYKGTETFNMDLQIPRYWPTGDPWIPLTQRVSNVISFFIQWRLHGNIEYPSEK